MSKLFTATCDIVALNGSYTTTPSWLLNRLAYMIEYSDDATMSSLFSFSDVPFAVDRYGLSGATNNGSLPCTPTSGRLDSVTATPGGITVAGWAYNRVNSASSNQVVVSVNGQQLIAPLANKPSAAVNRILHLNGSHGFAFRFLSTPGKSYNVCVTRLPRSKFSTAQSLGCNTIRA